MAVNLSDLAAMGAQPRWCTLALTLPTADELWLDGFSRGLFELADRFGVSLVGGNLTPRAVDADAAAHGQASSARSMLTRGGGHVGDDIYVTGTLGDSAAGHHADHRAHGGAAGLGRRGAEGALLSARAARRRRARARAARDGRDRRLGRAARRPRPHLQGAAAAARRSTSSACRCRPSSCRCSRRRRRSRTRSAAATTTSSASRRRRRAAEEIEAALEAAGTPVRRIGQLVAGQTVVCRRDGEPFTPAVRGYRHF